MKVKENPELVLSHQDLKSTVRVLNRILKDGFKLQAPKDLAAEPVAPKPLKAPAKKHSASEIPQRITIRQRLHVLLLQHAPADLVEAEVEEFFYTHRVDKIVHVKTPAGENSGVYIAKFALEEEALEALLYAGRKVKGRTVEVFPSTEAALQYALITNEKVNQPAERPLIYYKTSKLEILNNITARAVYMLKPNDIYVVAEEGVLSHMADLYPSEESELMKLLISPKPFKHRSISSEQRSRGLRIRGLNVYKKGEVLKFMRCFFVSKDDIIFNADSLNRAAVEIIVILMTPEERNRAVSTLHSTTHESRLVEVYSLS